MTNAEGFLLLTLPNVKLNAPFLVPPEQTGLLALECVTIPIENQLRTGQQNGQMQSQRDVWLVLRLNSFELPLSATDPIYHSRRNLTFTFKAPQGSVLVTVPVPDSAAAAEDLESFEVLLQQYGVLQEVDPDSQDNDLKNRLILVDEDEGNIVGTLGEQFTISEDPRLKENGREKDPVVVEIPEEGQEIRVHAITPDEQDSVIRSAMFISRGIVYATDMIGKGMGMAARYYVKNSTPNAEPMVFSDASKERMRKVHQVSGKAVEVTAKTTGYIHSMVDVLADRFAGSSSTQAKKPHRSATYAPGYYFNTTSSAASDSLTPDREKSIGGRRSPSPMRGEGAPPPLPPRKPRLLNRLLISTDLLLTTLENSAHTLVTHTTDNASLALGHTYGRDMGDAVQMFGQSAKNVGVVYVDARGVGRRALIKRVGKRVIKGRIGRDKEVVLGADAPDDSYGNSSAIDSNRVHTPLNQRKIG